MADQQDSQNEKVEPVAGDQSVHEVAPATEKQPVEAPESPPAPQAEAQPAETAEPEVVTEPPTEKKIESPEMLKKAENQPPTKPDERIWSLVSYIPMMALFALIMKPDSGFVKLHGRQGLLIFLIFFFNIFIYLVPFIGPVIGIIVHFGCMVIGLFSMYQAFIGNWWKIPVLGDVAGLLPVDAFTKVTRTAVMTEKVDDEKRAEEKSEEDTSSTSMESDQPSENIDQPEPPSAENTDGGQLQ